MIKQTIVITTAAVLIFSGMASRAAEIFEVSSGTYPRIASDTAGSIHVVFEGFSNSSNKREIFYCKSADMAATWTPPINISKSTGVSTVPAIAAEKNGAIDVVWRDTTSGELHPDIFFNRSADGGQTWGTAINISHTPGICNEPAIATGDDNSIHVVWVDTRTANGRPDIFYRYSLDGGNTWSACEDISPTPGISSVPTIIACNDGTVHCAWLDTTSGEERPDIFYVRKVDKTWTAPIDVSNSPRISGHPWLACGAKHKIFLCWNDNSQKENAADIWCAIGKNGKFEKPINISDTPGVSSQPIVVANEDGYVALVWSDTSKKLSKPDIYARVSTDNGDDFSNVLFLTNSEGLSRFPAAALIGTKMVIVWQDIVGSLSLLRATTLEVKGIGTGPVDQVTPTLHKLNRT